MQKLTYMEHLAKLNLWSLEERKNRSDLIEVFKMAKNLSSIPLTKFFELNTDNRTRGHSFKLVKHRCNCEVHRHFFSERVVNRWNMLDQDTISAKTVNGFKSKLELERKRKMGLFRGGTLKVDGTTERRNDRTADGTAFSKYRARQQMEQQ